MEEYLSYDEMMLSSLLGTSGPTFFINTGDRKNVSRKDSKGTFQERGIIIWTRRSTPTQARTNGCCVDAATD
jgi:hypothetical protein